LTAAPEKGEKKVKDAGPQADRTIRPDRQRTPDSEKRREELR